MTGKMSGMMSLTILIPIFYDKKQQTFFLFKMYFLFFHETTTTTISSLCTSECTIKNCLQFQTFLGLHDSFDNTYRHGFLAG